MRSISRLVELLGDWRYLVWRDGLWLALPELLHQIISLPYRHRKFTIIARSLLEPLPDVQPKIALDIREFKSTDLASVWQIDRPSEAKACAQRLTYGHKGLIAFHQAQPVGYAWASFEIEPSLERIHIHLNPDDALCVDVYTAPAFRRQGVQTALTLTRFQLLCDLGYSRAIAYIDSNNTPSLAVWRKLGSQVIGHIEFRRIGAWRQTSCDPEFICTKL